MNRQSETTDAALTVRVPIAIRQRGGRKVVLTPSGAQPWSSPKTQVDSILLRAVVKAFRWKRMLDEGEVATIGELAAREKLNGSYVSHALVLTLLAPELIESILDGTQPMTMQLQPLMRSCPVEWYRNADGSGG